MIVSLSNNKGGVLKTSCATNVACELVKRGERVVLVDLDPQANVTTTFYTLQEKKNNKWKNIVDFLKKRAPIEDIIDLDVNHKIRNNVLFYNKVNPGELAVIHGSFEINNYENDVAAGAIGTSALKHLLEGLNKAFDYVIIDTPPAVGSATETAISNSDLIVVPFELNLYSIDGLITLVNKIVKTHASKQILLIPTRVTKTVNFHKNWNDIIESINELPNKNIIISNTKISHNNSASIVIQYQQVPQVLTVQRLKSNERFINEYKTLVDEIIANIWDPNK